MSKLRNSVLFLVVICAFARLISGFSTGAPDNTCWDPSTFHTEELNETHVGVIMPQNASTNPYEIRVQRSYMPGGVVNSKYTRCPNQDGQELDKYFFMKLIF